MKIRDFKYFYHMIYPIDWWEGWRHWDTLSFDIHHDGEEALKDIKAAFIDLGWEGDVRDGPYVTVIPTDDSYDPQYIVAFKQDNNGETFVASPIPLEHLSYYDRAVKS